jgi:hypothetical protein
MKSSMKQSPGNYKLKQHKQWFDEECSKFLSKRKQAKLQWLQNQSQMNGDSLNNVIHWTDVQLLGKEKGNI